MKTNIKGIFRLSIITIAISSSLFMGGCSVHDSMHVRNGIDPKYQDDNVRFRNTYYFRVFNPCKNQLNQSSEYQLPEFQSLYRFKMTGKSTQLSNKVMFESGSLKSYELDPFGSRVIYDENIKSHRFQSEAETQQLAQQAQAWDKYQLYLDEYRKIKKANNTELKQEIKNLAWGLNILLASLAQNDNSLTNAEPVTKFIEQLKSQIALHRSLLTSKSTDFHDNLKVGLEQKVETLLMGQIAQSREFAKLLSNQIRDTIALQRLSLLETLFKDEFMKYVFGNASDNADKTINEIIENLIKNVKGDETIDSMFVDAYVGKINGNIKITLANNAKANQLGGDATKQLQEKIESRFAAIQKSPTDAKEEAAKLKLLKTQIDYQKLRGEILKSIVDAENPSEALKVIKETKLKDITDPQKATVSILLTSKINKYVADKVITEVEPPKPTTKLNDFINDLLFKPDWYAEKEWQEKELITLRDESIRNTLQSALEEGVTAEVDKLQTSDTPSSVLPGLEAAIGDQLKLATGVTDSAINKVKSANLVNKNTLSLDDATPNPMVDCNTQNIRENRGFQILGPEGWRTFDQDERLVMAMHTSNEPLLNSLKAVSQKVLQANQQDSSPNLVSLIQAQLKANNASHKVTQSQPIIEAQTDPKKAVEQVCELVDAIITELVAPNNSALAKLGNLPKVDVCKKEDLE